MEDLITWIVESVSAWVEPYLPIIVALGVVFLFVAIWAAVSGLRGNYRRTHDIGQMPEMRHGRRR